MHFERHFAFQNAYNWGINVFKICIWGRISSDIRSEINCTAMRERIYERISNDIPPQRIFLNIVIPILMHFYSFLKN